MWRAMEGTGALGWKSRPSNPLKRVYVHGTEVAQCVQSGTVSPWCVHTAYIVSGMCVNSACRCVCGTRIAWERPCRGFGHPRSISPKEGQIRGNTTQGSPPCIYTNSHFIGSTRI